MLAVGLQNRNTDVHRQIIRPAFGPGTKMNRYDYENCT